MRFASKLTRRNLLKRTFCMVLVPIVSLLVPKIAVSETYGFGSGSDNRNFSEITYIRTISGDLSVIKDGKEIISISNSEIYANRTVIHHPDKELDISGEGITVNMAKDKNDIYYVTAISYNDYKITFNRDGNSFKVIANGAEIISKKENSVDAHNFTISNDKYNINVSSDDLTVAFNKNSRNIQLLILKITNKE